METGMAPLLGDTSALSMLVGRHAPTAAAALRAAEFDWLFVTPDW
jgi:hypothetical protein